LANSECNEQWANTQYDVTVVRLLYALLTIAEMRTAETVCR